MGVEMTKEQENDNYAILAGTIIGNAYHEYLEALVNRDVGNFYTSDHNLKKSIETKIVISENEYFFLNPRSKFGLYSMSAIDGKDIVARAKEKASIISTFINAYRQLTSKERAVAYRCFRREMRHLEAEEHEQQE